MIYLLFIVHIYKSVKSLHVISIHLLTLAFTLHVFSSCRCCDQHLQVSESISECSVSFTLYRTCQSHLSRSGLDQTWFVCRLRCVWLANPIAPLVCKTSILTHLDCTIFMKMSCWTDRVFPEIRSTNTSHLSCSFTSLPPP